METVPLLLESAAIIVAVVTLGLLTSWIDRKVTARVQARVGPPWYQPLADILKLLGKETLVPDVPGRLLFMSAPMAGFAGSLVAAVILGHAFLHPERGFAGDVIVLAYFLVMPTLAVILGGGASGNQLSSVGAAREMKLILGYELPYLIVIATIIARAGFDLRLGTIIAVQASAGWFLWSVSGLCAFVVLLLVTQAKLGLVPFDIAEADQELMGGIITEYSGPLLAMIRLTKTVLMAALPLLTVLLLMGGFRRAALGGIIGYVAVIALVTVLRNTNPRVRIDQAVRFFWGPVTLVAVAGFIAAMAGW